MPTPLHVSFIINFLGTLDFFFYFQVKLHFPHVDLVARALYSIFVDADEDSESEKCLILVNSHSQMQSFPLS